VDLGIVAMAGHGSAFSGLDWNHLVAYVFTAALPRSDQAFVTQDTIGITGISVEDIAA
jgi:hypothetical protein